MLRLGASYGILPGNAIAHANAAAAGFALAMRDWQNMELVMLTMAVMPLLLISMIMMIKTQCKHIAIVLDGGSGQLPWAMTGANDEGDDAVAGMPMVMCW